MIDLADHSDKAIATRKLLTIVEDGESFEFVLTPGGTDLPITYKG